METPTDHFIRDLTQRHRVIVLGGLAVIAHGFSRSTYDGDIWLDPMGNSTEWSVFLEKVCVEFGGLTLHRLPGWIPVTGQDLIDAVDETHMIRIQGLDCPLDVFRKPNEIEISDFDSFCRRATPRADGTLLPDPLDLIQSKFDTGRDKDLQDIFYLESVVRTDYKNRLPIASLEEAKAMLGRYSEWQVLLPAMQNPSPEVRELAMTHLREFAAAGDPFSQAILEGRELP
ncbi:MAG: hypothetical protein ACRDBP_00730 [Luteolibacter sp.]